MTTATPHPSHAALSSPRDITIPEAGSTTARAVLSRAIGRVVRELASIARRAPVPELFPLVQSAMKSAPGALASALRRPTVSTLVRCLRSETIPNREAIFVELTALLAFELALADALPGPVRLRRWPARWLSTTMQIGLRMPADARAVTVENGRLRVDRALDGGDSCGEPMVSFESLADGDPGATGIVIERPFLPIRGGVLLALADNNPIAMEEAHPEKGGNALDLGGHPASEWVDAFGAALDTIAKYLPELYGEIELYLHQIVPVGWYPERHFSASYQEAIGTIYMSLHPNHMTLTEAIIHEFSHNKLNALFELDEVLFNAWSPLYKSPVRPDPRPLHGVVLAVHAFQPVARLYERMIEQGDPMSGNEAFRGRFAKVRALNHEGAELILGVGKPTPVGLGLLDEMRKWDEHYARFEAPPLPHPADGGPQPSSAGY